MESNASGPSCTSWRQPGALEVLLSDVKIRTSSRFRASLGRFRARDAEIAIADWLLDCPDTLVREVLCHEAAHAAVHLKHGHQMRPHGKEWSSLMGSAGFPARVRIPSSELPAAHQMRARHASEWEHRCPVCQAIRISKTRNHSLAMPSVPGRGPFR